MGWAQRAGAQSDTPLLRWRPAADAPPDAWPLAVCGTVQCDCAKGARMVVTGARANGEWVLDCGHDIEITHFMDLPRPPAH
jgi:hypothetical protein